MQSLHALSDDVCHIVIREQQVMGSDLERMSKMLREAAGDLRACFGTMSYQLAQQSAELRKCAVQVQQHEDESDIEHLLLTTNEISSSVGNAVRALQFEDILQQLINHACLRVGEIEKMFVAIHEQVEVLYQSTGQDSAEIMSVLKKCRADIAAVSHAMQLSNPVKQQSLDKGDVELF